MMEKAEDSMGDQLERLNRYEVGFKLLPILVSTFNGCLILIFYGLIMDVYLPNASIFEMFAYIKVVIRKYEAVENRFGKFSQHKVENRALYCLLKAN